jgi:site-specific DNA-methyltransferase (adenine-specific)
MFSKSDNVWLTPLDLFDDLQKTFDLQLDPCAEKAHPLPGVASISVDENGLNRDWDSNTYINPPYSAIQLWVEKAIYQASKWRNSNHYVLLLPSRTGRPWFRLLLRYANAICFIEKRLKFSNSTNSAPFDSLIAVVGKRLSYPQVQVLEKYGAVI